MLKLNQDVFHDLNKSRNKLYLVNFYKEGCPHCLQQEERLQQLEKTYDTRASFLQINVQEEFDLSGIYEIDVLPTLLYFANGELKERLEGCQTSLVIEANMHKLFHLVNEEFIN